MEKYYMAEDGFPRCIQEWQSFAIPETWKAIARSDAVRFWEKHHAECEAVSRKKEAEIYKNALRNGYKGRCGVQQRWKISTFWGEETNPFACAEKCNDGGGYFQPAGGAVVELEDGTACIVEYEDSSCGDFGSRKSVSFSAPGYYAKISWGAMSDACIDSEDVQDSVMASVSGFFGIDAWSVTRQVEYLVNQAAYKWGI